MATEPKGSFSSTMSQAAIPVPADSPIEGGDLIVVDLGKKSRKSVRKLKKGKPGGLLDSVNEAIEHLRENGAITAGVRPVVLIVREKSKKKAAARVAKMWGLG